MAPAPAPNPTKINYGSLAPNISERSEAGFHSVAALSSKMACQKLKEDCPADYSKLKYALTKGTSDKLMIMKNLIAEKEGKLNLESIAKAQYVRKEILSHITLHNLQDSFLLVHKFTLRFPAITTGFTNLLEDQKASNEYSKFQGRTAYSC